MIYRKKLLDNYVTEGYLHSYTDVKRDYAKNRVFFKLEFNS